MLVFVSKQLEAFRTRRAQDCRLPSRCTGGGNIYRVVYSACCSYCSFDLKLFFVGFLLEAIFVVEVTGCPTRTSTASAETSEHPRVNNLRLHIIHETGWVFFDAACIAARQ